MAFPRNLLNEKEELVLDLRPHWFFLAKPVVYFAGALILTFLAALLWKPTGTVNSVVDIACAVLVLVTLVFLVWEYLVWTSTMFVLTSDRIVSRRGVLTKSGVEIPLERVNTVFFQQGVFERMIGSGDLAIESAGERGTETFNDVRKPSVVQKEIYVQMEANENRKFDRMRGPAGGGPGAQGGFTGDPTQVQGTGQSIPDQIEKLAELHQRGVLSDAEYQRKKAELLDRM